MFEVEVKATCNDLEGLKKQLIALGCEFGPSTRQDDSVYLLQEKTLATIEPGDTVLRIRTTTYPDNSQKHIFTLKQKTGNDLAKHERETAIEDPGQLHEICVMMGYTIDSQVCKTRQKTNYQGKEICLDTVQGLGSFIEIEQLVDQGDAEEIQEILFQFLESLGVTRNARVTKGYDVLLYEQQKK